MSLVAFNYSEELIIKYTHRYCLRLAKKLHQRLGYDIYAVYTDTDVAIHYVVKIDTDTYVDICGIWDYNSLIRYWQQQREDINIASIKIYI